MLDLPVWQPVFADSLMAARKRGAMDGLGGDVMFEQGYMFWSPMRRPVFSTPVIVTQMSRSPSILRIANRSAPTGSRSRPPDLALTDPQPIPRDTDYASVLESDAPIIVQHTRLDSRRAELALLSTMAFAEG